MAHSRKYKTIMRQTVANKNIDLLAAYLLLFTFFCATSLKPILQWS